MCDYSISDAMCDCVIAYQIQVFVLKYVLCEVSRRFVTVLALEPRGKSLLVSDSLAELFKKVHLGRSSSLCLCWWHKSWNTHTVLPAVLPTPLVLLVNQC